MRKKYKKSKETDALYVLKLKSPMNLRLCTDYEYIAKYFI